MSPAGPEDLVRAIEAAGVREARVIDAFRSVPRARFVPPDLVDRAYVDEPLPIPHGQVTTQPSLVAKMIEALDLGAADRVLEVGTGFGFQTAILGRLAAVVYSIERYEDIARAALRHLEDFGVLNVTVEVGDGSAGLPSYAPYDAIVVSAAFPRVPTPLAQQLVEKGTLVQPIGPGGAEDVRVFEKLHGRLRDQGSVVGAHFVRLFGRFGFPTEDQ